MNNIHLLLMPTKNWSLKFFAKGANRITVYDLPSYSPDYNPIEKLWKKIKEKEIYLLRQSNEKVVGYYDMGSQRKIGTYIGTIRGRFATFTWKRFEGIHRGDGGMFLLDSKTLLIDLYRKEPKESAEQHIFRLLGRNMPSWLSETDFVE